MIWKHVSTFLNRIKTSYLSLKLFNLANFHCCFLSFLDFLFQHSQKVLPQFSVPKSELKRLKDTQKCGQNNNEMHNTAKEKQNRPTRKLSFVYVSKSGLQQKLSSKSKVFSDLPMADQAFENFAKPWITCWLHATLLQINKFFFPIHQSLGNFKKPQ